MANKPNSCYSNGRCNNLTSKSITDLPLPIDLSKDISSIFDVKSRKQERISEYMCRTIRKMKLKALQRIAKSEVIPSITRPITSKEFRRFSENCPITDMSRLLEKSIRQKINTKGLEERFPQLLDDIMKDAKLEFRKITRCAGVNLKVKEKYPEDFTIKDYKLLGKTERYQHFLCVRKQLGMRWILHHNLMKNVLNECVLGLPNVLFKIEVQQVLNIDDLQYIFKEKVKSSAAVLHDFHKRLSTIIDRSENIFKKRPSKFLPACTGLFSIYICKSIAQTIEGVVKFTESIDIPPYLKLYVDFESNLVLTPTDEQVIQMFDKLLNDIISIGNDLNIMEKGRMKGCESKRICLYLTQEFIENCRKNIVNNITRLYQPVLNYLDKLGLEFTKIYSDINLDNLCHNNDILFEEGCRKIEYYKSYIHNVAHIPDHEYFRIGQLDLTNYREKLHSNLQTISDSIFKNLSHQHLWQVNDICESYQLIKTRASQKPATTEELIEIGKFMSWVKNEQVEDLNRRVHAALKSLCSVITLGLLDEDHIRLNSSAMNWIKDIVPIIEQHSITYEQLKFEAEEKLQKVVEDINVLITDMYPLLIILDEMDDIKQSRKYLSSIILHMTKIKEIERRIEWINNEEMYLSFPKSSYVEFENLKDYVYPFYHLLKLSLDVQRYVSVWHYGQFDLLDYGNANDMVEKCCKELGEIQKNYRKKLRQAQDENKLIRFKGTVDDPDILNWPAPLKLCGMSLNILEEFKPSLTIMKIMCNDALRSRHWEAMSKIAGFNLMPNAGTTLKKMVEYDLQDNLGEYEIISICATKEQQLLDHLSFLKDQWQTVNFAMKKNEPNIRTLIQLEEIQTVVDEHIIKILNMRSSVFVKPYEKDVLNFYEEMLKISCVINNWITFQNVYLKLIPIFSFEEVIKHIPNEENDFKKCDSVFKNYIKVISENARVIDVVTKTPLVEELQNSLNTLEKVQKGVNTYLKLIRLKCPRLYLVSDEEVVKLVALNGNFSDQTFLIKIFPGVKCFRCDEEGKISGLLSLVKEELVLKNQLELSGKSLDTIINDIQSEMIHSLKYRTTECYKIFKKTGIKDLVKKYPQQSLHLMAKIFWTDQIENALKLSHNIKLLLYKKKLEENIDQKINIINKNEISHLELTVFRNLLLTDLNNKYLLSSFIKDGLVIDNNHFKWQVQLRYYFQESICFVQVLKHSSYYSYEYIGNPDQIILTPLVDRCFISLLNAYYLNFFGLVKGQSQTGKTVIVKSLADALGKLYFPFNCITRLSTKSLLQILNGVVQCGAWLSIKNLDRVKTGVLSAISQELLSIREGKILKSDRILLNGVKLPFDSTCFVLVHLSVKNAAKTEIPENFKVLFRTFTLGQPNFDIIIEGLLACQGIKNFKKYSKILQQSFILLGDILCFQNQYAFKLRAIKLVLTLFQKNVLIDSNVNYLTIFCNSIREAFLPSLVEIDHEILEDILSNIFHDFYTPMEYVDNNKLRDILETLSHKLNIFIDSNTVKKVSELYTSLKTGRSIILLGNTYTAKTTVLKLCSHLFKELDNVTIPLHIINPKCLSYKLLIGESSVDKNIRWIDGVLLKILRALYYNPENDFRKAWVLFDGYIDETWTKDLLSILEEGKLYLESLDILMLDDKITFIFESTNLENCSPSMVSRCTTVYFPQQTLENTSLVATWLRTCMSEWMIDYHNHIEVLLEWFIPPCLEALCVLDLEKYCELDKNTIVKNILTYFQLILDDASSKINKKDEDPKNMLPWIHATFIQAGILGCSSFMPQSSRQKLDEFYKQLWKGQNQSYPYPKSLERLEVSVPSEGALFDYCYLYKQRGTWKLWGDLLKNEKNIEIEYLSNYIIPTVDSVRLKNFLDLHIKYDKEFLVIGPKSSGKSIAFKDCYMNRSSENHFVKAIITCGENITANSLQKLILSKLNKGRTECYFPSSDKHFICFIDDLHYSLKDEYNVSSAQELLRQYLDHNVWYDLKSSEKIFLAKTNFIASVGLTAEQSIPKRFLRHFNLFGSHEFSQETLFKIYSQNLMQAWKKSGYPSDMLTVVNQIVNASITLYLQIKHRMKSTLEKCHYIFDIGSLFKVIQGCTYLKKETYDGNKKIHIKLWAHEIFRVFADRFYLEDIEHFLTKAVEKAIVEYFSEEVNDIFVNCDAEIPFAQLFFGTFQDKDLGISSRHYDEINFRYLKEICIQCLRDYNENYELKLEIILFNYALENLSRICRLLSMSNENALFLGTTACGRRSLTQFASFMYKYKFFQPTITRRYGEQCWKNDFKWILKLCGGMEEKYVLLLAEEHLITENFLEVVDYYIRDGEITDLYDFDEKQELLELCRLAAQGGNRNLDISSQKVFLYFNKECRQNFHIFLSLNSSPDILRKRILRYPYLVTHLNVILWRDWPDSALQHIGKYWTKNIDLEEEIKDKIISATIYFHRVCQSEYNMLKLCVTPMSYIHLNKLFADLISEKQKKLILKKNKFQQGLAKLSYAATQIFNMQKALAEYQPLLADMTKNAIQMTEQIALETIEVEKASALVRKDEKIASEQAGIAQVLKSECESELAQAIPILEDAISALNTLKPSDITLVKSMKNPPDAIKLVMASVCVIKDVKADRIPDPSTGRKTIDYWGPSKRILGDMNFLQTLKDFDKDHIKPEVMIKIRKEYLPHKDFKSHVVAKASSAAEGLCKWIIAMDMYDRVAKEVAPKKEKLNKAEKEYAETMMILNQKKEEVVRIEEKLAQLNILLDEATKKQVKLQIEVDLCNKKLSSAQKLIGSLSGEKLRWTEAAEKLQKHYNVLSGDVLLSSAIIAYLSSLDSDNRNGILQKWRNYVQKNNIPVTEDFNFSSVLSSDVEIEHWIEYGLPSDSFSVENAIIFKNSKYFSLFLDPHGQALEWIVNLEAANNIIITKFSFDNWLSDLKYCISSGKSILIKDTKGRIPPCLNGFIYGQIFTKNTESFVKIDGENMQIHPSAKIYLVSLHHNVNYRSELKSKLTFINFSFTLKALREGFLDVVTEIENPEIQRLSIELIEMNRENKAELKELETKILNTLCESETDILEDEKSILILDKSKELTKIAMEKQEKSKEMSKVISEFRARYIGVAEHVTCLFFCVSDLQKLDKIYQFSLKWFKNIYFVSILNAGKSKNLNIRCKNFCETFTYDLYKNVSKGLFEKDKLLFTFWLACEVAINAQFMAKEDLLIFFSMNEPQHMFTSQEDIPSWVSKKIWFNLHKLEGLGLFNGITKAFIDNSDSWKHYFESTTEELPDGWNGINTFKRLILIQILKPEHLYNEITSFIKLILGDKFLLPMFFNMQEIYNESYNLIPVMFILTPGFDARNILQNFANIKQVLHKFNHLSLDLDSTKNSERLVKQGQIEGCWVLLQNCHYTDDWLYRLEENLEKMDFHNTHENFRLFLTADKEHDFPLELMQNSIKVIDESPNNLRTNLLKMYNKPPISMDDYFYGCPGQQESFSKLLYNLCHFHFLIQERQKFVNWNILYKFEESDLLLSLEYIRDFVNEQTCLYEKIYYIIGELNYNGHLENEWEKAFIIDMLKNCINEKIFEKNLHIFNNAKQYYLPKKNDRRDYVNHIYNLPSQDPPETLFLAEYDLRRYNVLKSRKFLDRGAKILYAKNEYNLIKDEIRILSIIDDLLMVFPESTCRDQRVPYEKYIIRELSLYDNLVKTIRNSLTNLKFALQGEQALSNSLEDCFLDISLNKVPKIWSKFCYPTLLSLSNFAQRVIENICFIKNCAEDQTRFLLRAFFYPRAILSYVALRFIRKAAIPIENFYLEYNLIDDNEDIEDKNNKIILDGLYIFGARYDSTQCQIIDVLPKTYYSSLCSIAIRPVVVNNSQILSDSYKCCVFKTQPLFLLTSDELFLSGIHNFITNIYLKCYGSKHYWIKRGVTIICEID